MSQMPVLPSHEKIAPRFQIDEDFSGDPVVTGFIQAFEDRCLHSPEAMLTALNRLGAAATADTVSLKDLRQTGRPELPTALDGTMSETDIITSYFSYRFSETHGFDPRTEDRLDKDEQFARLLRAHKRQHNESRQHSKSKATESHTALDARDAIRRYRLLGFLDAVIESRSA